MAWTHTDPRRRPPSSFSSCRSAAGRGPRKVRVVGLLCCLPHHPNAPSRFDLWFWSPGGLGWGHWPTPSYILKTNLDEALTTRFTPMPNKVLSRSSHSGFGRRIGHRRHLALPPKTAHPANGKAGSATRAGCRESTPEGGPESEDRHPPSDTRAPDPHRYTPDRSGGR